MYKIKGKRNEALLRMSKPKPVAVYAILPSNTFTPSPPPSIPAPQQPLKRAIPPPSLHHAPFRKCANVENRFPFAKKCDKRGDLLFFLIIKIIYAPLKSSSLSFSLSRSTHFHSYFYLSLSRFPLFSPSI